MYNILSAYEHLPERLEVARDTGNDVDEKDDGDTVSDSTLTDSLTQPHNQCTTRGQCHNYDDHDNLIEVSSFNYDEHLNWKHSYVYEYDEDDNWVRQTIYRNNVPYQVIEREIAFPVN